MLLYLVRHGRARAGVEELDPGLDDLGRRQAGLVAEALSNTVRGADRLVSSPMRRALQTASIIAGRLGLSLDESERVSEVFHPSMQVGARRAMMAQFLSSRWRDQSAPLRAWRTRVLETLLELGKSESPVIVVSHLVAISVVIGACTGDDRVSPCVLANASITTVEVTGQKLSLRRAGDVRHLPPDAISLRAPTPDSARPAS